MKSLVDEEINLHMKEKYINEELERAQFIPDLDIGDEIVIQVLDKDANVLANKTFIAKYKRAHLNCQWQDMGDYNPAYYQGLDP